MTVKAAIGHMANADDLEVDKPYEIFVDTEPRRPKTNM